MKINEELKGIKEKIIDEESWQKNIKEHTYRYDSVSIPRNKRRLGDIEGHGVSRKN